MLPRGHVDFDELVIQERAGAQAAAAQRQARRQELRRRRARRRAAGAGVLLLGATTVATAATWRPWESGDNAPRSAASRAAPAAKAVPARAERPAKPAVPVRFPEPREVRGVHITLYVAGDRTWMGKFYAAAEPRRGLNALQVDIKDEAGIVGFDAGVPLARKVGAVQKLYDPRALSRRAHKAGLYLIGRIVMFEDPVLDVGEPSLAIKRRDGSVWKNHQGLGWTNPYNRRVWDYGIDLAKAAGRRGFDEIQFDYVRFPTDGDMAAAVYRPKRSWTRDETIKRFLETATAELHPLGLKVSVDMFGLAATHKLGIGQNPRLLRSSVDVISPMTYPSHYYAGEYNIPNPDAAPYRTMRASLRDWKRQLRGGTARLRPWIQDFSLGTRYGPAEVKAQIRAVREVTSDGFLLWNAGVEYTEGVLPR